MASYKEQQEQQRTTKHYLNFWKRALPKASLNRNVKMCCAPI